MADVDCFDRFRGKLIATFARAEMAVSETLIALGRHADWEGKVATPLLIGQRLAALEAALTPKRSTLHGASRVLEALAAFRKHDGLRQLLCHGVGKVCTNRDGSRLLTLDVRVLGSQGERRQRWWIGEAELPALTRRVAQDAKTMCDRLDRLRGTLES